jgi:NAD(P)-dependent dehydrogenase (short-subunit alcohol dehydrogenase family)
MPLPLDGKVALVTGSSRGIGKSIALHLARDGAAIVATARDGEASAGLPGSIAETAAEIEALGGRALPLRLDVTFDAAVKQAVERALAHFGRIDILVNNAAWVPGNDYPSASYLDGDVSVLDRSYAVNVRSPFVIGQLVAAAMAVRGGGLIVNISSGAARHRPPPDGPGRASAFGSTGQEYGASKAALDRLTTGLAHELYAQNIALVSINPGFTRTERLELNPLPGIDLSRAISPDITAKAVAFIARNPMAFTGQLITAQELVEKEGL